MECLTPEFPNFMTQNNDGSFVIGEPAELQRNSGFNISAPLVCYYRELDGSLFPNITQFTYVGNWNALPVNRHFFLDVEQFVVKCWMQENPGN